MKSFQQKRGWKSIMYSTPVLVFLAVILLIFAWAVFHLMGKMQMTRENRKIAENKVAELQREREKLSADIEKLKTDGGVEESIRNKFGWAKEGEGLIVIVEDENSRVIEKEESDGFWSSLIFWKNWFR